MKHLKYLLMAALVAMPLTACDEDDDPVVEPTPTGTVTGTVSAEGTGLAGVSVTLVGAVSQSATTGAGGAYTFTDVPAGSYGVSIDASTHPEVSFAVTSKVTSITTMGQTATVDFTGSYIRTASITAMVMAAGAPVAGVSVAVTGGPDAVTVNAVTDVGGQGSATGLRGGDYTVTISDFPEGVEFTTVTRSVTVATGESKTATFTGVAPDVPATISIQSITKGGSPIDLTNVYGQIEIAVNIVRGNRDLDKVHVLIGDIVVASQVFASLAPEEEAELASTEVLVLNVPTNQVKQGEYAKVPVVFNGQNIIKAHLYEVGAEAPIPTNEVPVVMNNPDVLLPGNVSFEHEAGVNCVTVNATLWCTGGLVITGYEYLSFGTIQPEEVWPAGGEGVQCTPDETSILGTPITGQVVTNMAACDGVEGSARPLFEYGFWVEYPEGAEGPDGSDLLDTTEEAGEPFSRLGAAFTLAGEDRWFIITRPPTVEVDALWVDNKAPVVEVFGQTQTTLTVNDTAVSYFKVAFNRYFDEPWVNAYYEFADAIVAEDGGVGLDMDTKTAWEWAGTTTADWPQGICIDASEVVVTGDDLEETLVSDGTPDGYKLCGTVADKLGNVGFSRASNWFGVDKVAPIIQVSENTPELEDVHMAIYSVESEDGSYNPEWVWGFEAIDERSGFHQGVYIEGLPASQSLRHFPGDLTAPLECEQFDSRVSYIGPGVQWVTTDPVPFTCLADLAEPGYFWYEGQVTDRAGNVAVLGSALFAVDDVEGPNVLSEPPTFDAMQFGTTFYNPGEPAAFSIFASDDLEVIEADVGLVHPSVLGPLTLFYGWNAIADFQRFDGIDPFDITRFSSLVIGETVETALPVFGRLDFVCIDADVPYLGCAQAFGVTPDSTQYNVGDDDFSMLPTDATGRIQDVGFNVTDLADPITFLPAQWQSATAAPWSAIAAGTEDELIIRRFYIEEATSFKAVMEAPTSIEVPFFDAVALVNNDEGEIAICGFFDYVGTTDTGFDRFFNYSATVPEGSVCDGAEGTWHAVGLKGAAALVTLGIEVEEEDPEEVDE